MGFLQGDPLNANTQQSSKKGFLQGGSLADIPQYVHVQQPVQQPVQPKQSLLSKIGAFLSRGTQAQPIQRVTPTQTASRLFNLQSQNVQQPVNIPKQIFQPRQEFTAPKEVGKFIGSTAGNIAFNLLGGQATNVAPGEGLSPEETTRANEYANQLRKSTVLRQALAVSDIAPVSLGKTLLTRVGGSALTGAITGAARPFTTESKPTLQTVAKSALVEATGMGALGSLGELPRYLSTAGKSESLIGKHISEVLPAEHPAVKELPKPQAPETIPGTVETLNQAVEKLRSQGWSEEDINKYKQAVLSQRSVKPKESGVKPYIIPSSNSTDITKLKDTDLKYFSDQGYTSITDRYGNTRELTPSTSKSSPSDGVPEYGMSHRPTKTGATADNVTQTSSDSGFPNDFYDHPEYYANMGEASDRESFDVLRRIRDNPDAEVTIYRASPKNQFNDGDWVTLSKSYAEQESLAEGVKVHAKKVKARDIQFAGDSINEFGYYPQKSSIKDKLVGTEQAGLKPKVKDSVDPLESLKQEALKYKSAEEFVLGKNGSIKKVKDGWQVNIPDVILYANQTPEIKNRLKEISSRLDEIYKMSDEVSIDKIHRGIEEERLREEARKLMDKSEGNIFKTKEEAVKFIRELKPSGLKGKTVEEFYNEAHAVKSTEQVLSKIEKAQKDITEAKKLMSSAPSENDISPKEILRGTKTKEWYQRYIDDTQKYIDERKNNVGKLETKKPLTPTESTGVVKPTKVDTEFKSRVYERLQNEHPELTENVTYTRMNMEKDIDNAIKLVEKDVNKAYDVATGRVEDPNVTATHANIVLAEKALQDGNDKLYIDLVKNRSLAQTRRGQELVAEKSSITDNSTSRYVKELINTRLNKLGDKLFTRFSVQGRKLTSKQRAMKIIDSQVKDVEIKIKSKKLDVKTALSLLDKLECI